MAFTVTTTRNYSEYLDRVCGQIGMARSALTADELGFLNAYFNNNLTLAWNYGNWLDICPFGEARFVGNVVKFPNDITQTTFWSTPPGRATATVATICNPLDGRFNVSKLSEVTANTDHFTSQTLLDMVPAATYVASAYSRPIGGRWLYMTVSDGGSSGNTFHSAFFNLASSATGTVSTGDTASITQLPNGFCLCQLTFTASATATVSAFPTFNLMPASANGTTSYAGDPLKGLYLYGCTIQQTSLLANDSLVLPWAQLGEQTIGSFYQAWRSPPMNAQPGVPQGYQLSNDGIHLIGTAQWNTATLPSAPYAGTSGFASPYIGPVYIYYRVEVPTYYGSAWSQASSYTGITYTSGALTYTGDVVQFTNPTTGVINYYRCLSSTSPGQSPVTNPSSWELQIIPDVFFQYVCYKSVADWLKADGQWDKAQIAEQEADNTIDAQYDTQEREMGFNSLLKMQTHLTSRGR